MKKNQLKPWKLVSTFCLFALMALSIAACRSESNDEDGDDEDGEDEELVYIAPAKTEKVAKYC